MSLQQQRKGFLGLGKESSAGVPVTPTVFLPFLSQELQGKHEPIGNQAAQGTREAERGSVEGKKWGEGGFEVNIDESLIGHMFLMLLGTVNTATVSGSIKDHTFSRNNSNQPQTYTITVDRVTDKKMFPYCVANSGELAFSDGLVTMKMDMLSHHPVTSVSGTLTVTSGHLFSWKDASVKFGATIGAAAAATPTQVSEFKLSIENNAAPSYRSGVQEPASIDVGNFRVSGEFKLFFEDTTQLENYRTLTKQAMQIVLSGRGLAGGYRESITINLPMIRLADATVDTPIDDFSAVVCAFEAEYDATTSKMIDVVVRNITASY